MSEIITMGLNVSIPNGPTITLTRKLPVDAYDKFDVTVPDGTTALRVQLLPSGTSQVSFMLVSAPVDQLSDKLSYKVNDKTDSYKLDGPHMLIGTGAVGMLDPDPAQLIFANSSGKDARITILIGRDATPE